jgi:hypothetical protein
MSVSTAWARGDTVEAFDGRLRRITRFPPDGSHEVVSFTSAPGYVDSAVRGWSPGGWLLYGLVAGGAGRRDRIAVHHFARDGTHVGEVAQIDGMRRFQAGSAGGPTPLSPSAWLELHQGLFYLAEALDPVVRVLDSTGAVVREITWPPAPSASPEEALAAVIDSVAASEGSLFPPEYLGAAPVPDRLPLFWGFLVDDEGFVWVRRYDPLRNAAALGGLAGAGAGGEWLLFTPEGAPAGAIRVPEALAPSQITSDALVGIHRDQLGVESVRVHPLRRAPG